MELKSLSASTVKVWEKCPARAAAGSINRVPQGPAEAADFGSACHQALEFYVRAVHMEHSIGDDVNILIQLFLTAYTGYFGADRSRIDVGVEIMKKWHARTDFSNREVLSVEIKKNFQLPTSRGPLTFNYIFDRVDRLVGKDEIEIIDYKSWLMPRVVDNMEDDPQMRAYALAGAIEYNGLKPDRVWVTLDQLRYDTVGTVFTRKQNTECWEYLKQVAEEIIAADPNNLDERLNSECGFCIRRHACKKLQDHATVSGPMSLDDPIAATKRLAEVQGMMRGLTSLENDLNAFLIEYAHQEGDIETWEMDGVLANVAYSKRRTIPDPHAVAEELGPELFAKYGNMTLGQLDAAFASGEVDAETKKRINKLIKIKFGEPKIKAVFKGGLR